ncbi:MAG: MipA/OmpV family protein [Planctomycetota bacterium]
MQKPLVLPLTATLALAGCQLQGGPSNRPVSSAVPPGTASSHGPDEGIGIRGTAQEPGPTELRPDNASPAPTGFVALGVAAVPEFTGSDALQLVPSITADIDFDGIQVSFAGLGGEVDLVRDPFWRFGPSLSLSLPRDSEVDSDRIAALTEVETALEVGAFIGFETRVGWSESDALRGSLALRQDVLDSHDGLLAVGQAEYSISPSERWRLSLATNFTVVDGNYADAFFSVSQRDSAVTGLRGFDADGGLRDIGAQVVGSYSWSRAWGVYARAAYNRLLGDAADSPIVTEEGSEDQLQFDFGLTWGF